MAHAFTLGTQEADGGGRLLNSRLTGLGEIARDKSMYDPVQNKQRNRETKLLLSGVQIVMREKQSGCFHSFVLVQVMYCMLYRLN